MGGTSESLVDLPVNGIICMCKMLLLGKKMVKPFRHEGNGGVKSFFWGVIIN